MPRRRPQQCDRNTQREHSRECVRKNVTKRARLKKPIGGCLAVDLSNAIGTLNVNIHASVYEKKVTKRARLKKPIGGCLAVDLSNAIGTLNVNIHESVYEKKKR